MDILKKSIANLSHSAEHIARESQFCLTLPKNCGATFSDFKKLLELIHVHSDTAKFTTLGGHEQKEPKRMGRIIHQMLKKYSFRKLFHLNIFDQKSRIFGIASCRPSLVHWKPVIADTKKLNCDTQFIDLIRSKSSDAGSNGEFHYENRKPEGIIKRRTVELFCLFSGYYWGHWNFEGSAELKLQESIFLHTRAVWFFRKDTVILLKNVAPSIKFYTPAKTRSTKVLTQL